MSRWTIEKDGTGIERSGTGIERSGTGIERSGTGIEKSGTGIERSEQGLENREPESDGFLLPVRLLLQHFQADCRRAIWIRQVHCNWWLIAIRLPFPGS